MSTNASRRSGSSDAHRVIDGDDARAVRLDRRRRLGPPTQPIDQRSAPGAAAQLVHAGVAGDRQQPGCGPRRRRGTTPAPGWPGGRPPGSGRRPTPARRGGRRAARRRPATGRRRTRGRRGPRSPPCLASQVSPSTAPVWRRRRRPRKARPMRRERREPTGPPDDYPTCAAPPARTPCRPASTARTSTSRSTTSTPTSRTCAECRRFSLDITDVHRLVRVRAAEPVPDLTRSILDATAGVAPGQRSTAERGAAAGSATGSWSSGSPCSPSPCPRCVLHDSGNAIHLTRELSAWDAAFGAGLLFAAWQPGRARGLLPMAAVLAGAQVLGFGHRRRLGSIAGRERGAPRARAGRRPAAVAALPHASALDPVRPPSHRFLRTA